MIYPVIFVDAIDVKVRDGQVRNIPVLCCDGPHRERRTRHPGYLVRRRPRKARGSGREEFHRTGRTTGLEDVPIAVYDGLSTVFRRRPDTTPGNTRLCSSASSTSIGNSFRYAGRQHHCRDRESAQTRLHSHISEQAK